MPDFLERVSAAEANPEDADFIELRRAYVQSDSYYPTSHYSSSKLMGNTNNLSDFDAVANFCQDILQHNPMDLEVRLLLEFACEKQGLKEEAQRHHAFVQGMIEAIFSQGDGKSAATALPVVAVAEEYTILSLNGLRMHQQYLVEKEGRWLDILDCTPRGIENASPMQIYFDITHPYRFLQNML